MKDHWWWRPGWAPGRRYYAWHLTFADAPEVCAAAAPYRSALRPLGILDDVPDPWLHLTMQGIGFDDDVTADEARDIAAAARGRVSTMAAIDVSLPAAQVGTEGVYFPVDPWVGLQGMRLAVRSAVVDVIGSAEGDEETFWPHVSVAYCNADGPTGAVLDAVESVPATVVRAKVSHVDLILLSRDTHLYQWTTVTRLTMR